MDYKIINARKSVGQIDVAYLQDGKTVAVYTMDVPIIDGAYLTPEQLTEEIQHRAPVFIAERALQNATATGFELLEALVEEQPPRVLSLEEEETLANAKMWEQVEFEKKLAAALLKFGLLESDPTTIEVSKL